MILHTVRNSWVLYSRFMFMFIEGGEKTCTDPPKIPNSEYLSAKTYPLGSEVQYYCTSSFLNIGGGKSKLTCSLLKNQTTTWVGERIYCRLSYKMRKYLTNGVWYILHKYIIKVRSRWCINQGIIPLHWSSFKEGDTLYPLVYFATREKGTIRWCNS